MVAAVWQERYVTRLALRLLRAWRRHVHQQREEPTSLCSLRARLRDRGYAGERDVRRRRLQRCALAALSAPFAEPRRCVGLRRGRPRGPSGSRWPAASTTTQRASSCVLWAKLKALDTRAALANLMSSCLLIPTTLLGTSHFRHYRRSLATRALLALWELPERRAQLAEEHRQRHLRGPLRRAVLRQWREVTERRAHIRRAAALAATWRKR